MTDHTKLISESDLRKALEAELPYHPAMVDRISQKLFPGTSGIVSLDINLTIPLKYKKYLYDGMPTADSLSFTKLQNAINKAVAELDQVQEDHSRFNGLVVSKVKLDRFEWL